MEPRLATFSALFLNNPNFRLRLISALVLAPIVLGAIYFGGNIFVGVTVVIVMVGIREWVRMVDPSSERHTAFATYAALLIIMVVGVGTSPILAALVGTGLMPILFLVGARSHPERAGWVTLGLPYMGGFGLALLYLRNLPDIGGGLVTYLFAVVWGTDIGAYIAGRMLGGPKLAPAISPNKTWAGLVGGMVLAALLGYSVAVCFKTKTPLALGALAFLIAIIAQLGDLFESHIKRRSGIKDSGGIIPGHGGILDRIDGLVFASIFFALFEIAVGLPQHWW
jgi:phosphatidate cytidylyltransferase